MSTGDFKLRTALDPQYAVRRIVGSGTAVSINAGEPTKQGSSGAVAIMADGDGTTSQVFTGISKSASTDTAAAAGEVYVWLPLPGLFYSGKPKSATAAITQAAIDALAGKRVVFDLTSSVWTVDSAAADATTNGVYILGGEFQTNTLFFLIRENIALYNPTT